jgi:hypothetical protein
VANITKTFTNFYLLIILSLIAGVTLGIVGTNLFMSAKPSDPSPQSEDNKKTTVEELASDQSAIITGQITEVEGRRITIRNLENKSGILQLADPVYINDSSRTQRTASASTDIKDIPLNQSVIVNASALNGEYSVTSITILPATSTLSSPPPFTTPKATPQ